MTTQSTTEVAMVDGLATDDLLNIRMKASPIEKVVGRLPNGATVRKHECKQVNGYEWCRVDAIEREGVSGWAPARYLQNLELGDEATGTAAAREPDAAVEEASVATPEAARFGGEATAAEDSAAAPEEPTAPIDEKLPASTVEEAPATKVAEETTPPTPEPRPAVEVPLPDGIEARFAGAPAAPAKEAQPEPEETVALAFAPAAPEPEEAPAAPAAAKGDKVSPEVVVSLPPRLEERFAAPEPDLSKAETAKAAPLAEPLSLAAKSGAVEVAEAKPVADDVPVLVPTPRPDPEAQKDVAAAPAEAAMPKQEASVAAPAAAVSATEGAIGEIPCARYTGQPMTRCEARVVRIAEGDADVTVAWPDGGTRVIRFRNGAPEGSNSRGEFRFTREGSLSMIRIGVSERFEIVDELSFGG